MQPNGRLRALLSPPESLRPRTQWDWAGEWHGCQRPDVSEIDIVRELSKLRGLIAKVVPDKRERAKLFSPELIP